ncbi:PAS domain-containing protein [Nodosilinea sp. PGN35]|uniref:PAS domain-containing protein n=1 Tax=Nodosilinea sp. PGN35 TaxID=3020489 RepID=UPI0023B2B8AB|nr:PAS domain-containing protein [Nodosilinea sp. TSF1-S3]MDF0369725.1 PAS domain-containing protein [Nodosilinea sp. TSF1-S3]
MCPAFVDVTASVDRTTSVAEVVRLMGNSQPRLACVFVVDGENLVGSFTEEALLPLVAQGRGLAELTIGEVMQTPAVSVRQSDLNNISIPAGLLQQHGTDYLAVVDEQGGLAGAISAKSLQPHLWEVLQGQQVELAHQREQITSLGQSAAQYQSLLQALPDLIVRTSAAGVYLECVGSADFELYCGDAALVGKGGDEILTAELATQRLKYIRQALQTGKLQIYEQQIVINGTLRTEEVRISVCGDGEVLVIVRDITDRKNLEDTNRAILEAIPDLLVRVNRQGGCLGILRGDSVKRVLLPPSDFSSYTIYDVLPHTLAQQRVQMAQQALDTGTVQLYEQPIEIDGELCWEEVRVSPVNPDEVLFMIRDISERKRNEAEGQLCSLALQQSEATQRAILRAIPDLLVRVSAEGRYLDFIGPDRSFNLFEPALVTPDGAIADLLPPEIAQPQLAAIQRALETRELQVYEQQIQVGGQFRDEEVRAICIGNNEVLLMIRDISEQQAALRERKQIEAMLRQSEAQSRAILSAIPDLMFRTTADGMYLEYIASRRVTDLIPATVISVGQSMVDLLPPEVAQRHLAAIRRALDTRTLQVYEQQIQIGDRTQYEEVRVIAAGDHEVLFMIRDITDRKQAEIALQAMNLELETRVAQRTAALQESEERWQLALQGSNASLWDWNVKTGKVFRTRRWHELRGLAAGTVSENPAAWSDRIHPDDRDRVLTAMADHLAQKTTFYQQEYRLRHEDGHYLWILDRGQAIWDEAGNPTRIIGSEMDITQRKRAELEAQTLKQQLEFVLSSSPAAIFTCQPAGDYATTFMSDNIVNVSGYTSAEFLSRPDFWTIHLHPEDAPRLWAELPALFGQGHHVHEYRFLHKAGHYIWVRSELRLIRDAQGTPVEIVGYFADIGDRKAIEHQLRKSEAALAEAQRMVHLGSWEVDVATQQLSWSDELFQIFGFNPSEPEPAYAEHFNLIHPEDRDRLEQYVEQAMRQGTPYEIELRIFRADGSIGYLDARGKAKLDDQGQVTTILGTALDITERKVAELERQNLSNRLALALRSGAIGCWDWDIQQNTILWDERMYELYGATDSANAVPYEIWASSIHPDDRSVTEALLQQAVLGQAVYEPEFRVIHGDGSILHIKAYGMVVHDSEGHPKSMIGVNLDISERKRSETERQQAEDRLQQINEQLLLTNAELDRATRLKDEFLANMSHELRTPLNAILGLSEGLKEHVFGSLSDRQRQAVETIERSGTHLLDLINDILDLSKIEADKLELETALVSVQYLCESSLTFVRQLALSKGIGLSLECAPATPDIVLDERRIRQVLINLLSNAVKFTPADGRVILWARAEARNGRNYLKLSISDTGIGIHPDDIAKLFQPFMQIDSSLSRHYSGTGLGLALVRKMVELHGGKVSVASKINQGSCFTLELPYLTESSRPAIATLCPPAQPNTDDRLLGTEGSAAPAVTQPAIETSLILLAEDNDMNVATVSSYLTALGYHLIYAKNGQVAVELAQTQSPDLILMDIQMPDMDGLEAMQLIRTDERCTHIPIVALTALAMPGDRERCLAAGASHYLAKPFKMKELKGLIQQLLPSA